MPRPIVKVEVWCVGGRLSWNRLTVQIQLDPTLHACKYSWHHDGPNKPSAKQWHWPVNSANIAVATFCQIVLKISEQPKFPFCRNDKCEVYTQQQHLDITFQINLVVIIGLVVGTMRYRPLIACFNIWWTSPLCLSTYTTHCQLACCLGKGKVRLWFYIWIIFPI